MSPKYRRGIAWASAGLLFVLFAAVRTKKPSANDEHSRLLELGDTCDRIQGGSISLKEWSTALLHGTRPQIYFEEQYCVVQQRLWDSGYITYREMEVKNLMNRSTALFQAVQDCSRTNAVFFRMQLNPTNESIEIWCRNQDLPLWNKTLADFGTPIARRVGRTR
jgi:hypothetical protein